MTLTFLFIGITVITSIYAWNNARIQYGWMMNPYEIRRRKQYFRFVSSGFIHQDGVHLFFNMFSLYFFGQNVEAYYTYIFGVPGLLLFGALYILGIVVSDIPSYLKHKNRPAYNSLGASGGVSAVIFASVLFDPVSNICLYAILCLPGFLLAILYLIYSYYQGKRGGDNINHDAHFYGAVFGIIFTIVIYPLVVVNFIEHLKDYSPFS